MSLEVVHLKGTESLCHVLKRLTPETSKITLTAQDKSQELHIHTDSRVLSFKLERDTNSGYFSLVKVSNSCGEFIGSIGQCLRTRGNEDSFKTARESLIKDAEHHRQQKLQILAHQVEAASLLKSERSAICKRALERNKALKRPSTKRLKTDTNDDDKVDYQTKNSSHVPASLSHLGTDQSTRTLDLTNSNKFSSDALKITSPTDESTKRNDASRCSAIGDMMYCTFHCTLAAHKRRSLEQQLERALAHPNLAERHCLIEVVRRELYALVDELINDHRLTKVIPLFNSP